MKNETETMTVTEDCDNLDIDILRLRADLRKPPSRIAHSLKIPPDELNRRMERLGLKIDGRRRIHNYEQLRQALAQGMRFEDAAGEFGVSKSRISHLATGWGVKQPPRPLAYDLDERIVDLHTNKRLAPSTIGHRTKLSTQEVYERLKKLGLAPHLAFKIWPLDDIGQALRDGVHDKDIALKFGISERTVGEYAERLNIRRSDFRSLEDNLLIEKYVNQLLPAGRVAKDLGYGRDRVANRLRILGVMRSPKEEAEAKLIRRLRENGTGQSLGKQGYPVVRVPEGHVTRSRLRNDRLAMAHIIEMEKHLGRPLAKNEVIHHIDFDKTNYSIENLYLCVNQAEHQRIHSALDIVCAVLFKKGIVKFNGTRYVIKEKNLEGAFGPN